MVAAPSAAAAAAAAADWGRWREGGRYFKPRRERERERVRVRLRMGGPVREGGPVKEAEVAVAGGAATAAGDGLRVISPARGDRGEQLLCPEPPEISSEPSRCRDRTCSLP